MTVVKIVLLLIFFSNIIIANNKFTEEELSYIKNSAPLKIGIENWYGVISLKNEEKPQIEGLAGKLFMEIIKDSGLKYEFVKDTWPNLLEAFKNKEIDILPATFYTKEREEFGEYTNKYLSVQNYLYVKVNNKSIKSFEDLKNKKLAIQKSFGTVTFIKELFPSIEIIETNSLEESILKVTNNEVDALFELQFSVEKKLQELLIYKLKAISQNDINAKGIYVFSKKDDIKLNFILNKSIHSLSNEKRNSIINKHLDDDNIKDINIAFENGKNPYVLSKGYSKGIEYDLIRKILDLEHININTVKSFPKDELSTILLENNNFDVAVNMKIQNNGLFYSDPFFSFHNVVISRIEDNLLINNIKDLKNKNVLAFQNAYKVLGDEYNSLFNKENRNSFYKEILDQEEQLKKFVKKEIDLIVIDKNIFKWFINKEKNENINNYRFNDILPKSTPRYLAFKNKKLKNIFNKNLKLLKKTSEYDEIFNDYIEGFIDHKVKLNSLISTLISTHLYNEESHELEKIIDIFSSLTFIEKVDIYNNDNELIYTSSNTELTIHTVQNSYYIANNITQKVGVIKVYYKNNLLKPFLNTSKFVPSIEKFKNFSDFNKIEEVYKNFGYLNNGINFSQSELEFLKKNKTITFSAKDISPLSIINKLNYNGLFNDYIKLIEKDTGLTFKYINARNNDEVHDLFSTEQIDIIVGEDKNHISDFKNFPFVSKSFVSFKYAIVMNKDANYLDGIKELKNKTISLVKENSSIDVIKKKYPSIKIILANNEKEAMSLVSKNEVDAFVGHSALTIYNIKNNLSDLKIVGISQENFNHYFFIQSKYPELTSIINKVIMYTTEKQKQDIKYKWIQTEVSTAIDTSIIYKIIFGFLIILLIVLFFIQKLSKAKKEVEKYNKEMLDSVLILTNTKMELISKAKDLKEQKTIFETLFNETSDGISLIKDGAFIDCNNAALKMLEYDKKEDFLNLTPEEISPLFQPDGLNSEVKASIFIEKCLKNGNSRFDWVHLKSSGEGFWVEVVLTRIKINHNNIIYVTWRDISDKKILEKEILDRNVNLEESILQLQETQKQLIEFEKMASLGGLVAGVAHEVNTPIGISLTGSTHLSDKIEELNNLYKDNKMSEEYFENFLLDSKDLANLINSNLKRAANLIKSFKHIAVDQTSEEKRNFNLKDYINEVLSSIHNVSKKRKINILVNCKENLNIDSFPGAFSQLFTNLLMNSFTHAYKQNDEGEISIDISLLNQNLEIIYKDDGKGIKEENLNKIFNPFFTTNRENGGSGLGLSIIYNIVTTKLNGKIKCERRHKGLKFIINLQLNQ